MNTETQNYEQERKILDSGNRREFASGAVRDIAEGKGRCDLLPLTSVARYLRSLYADEKKVKVLFDGTATILSLIDMFIRQGGEELIWNAITKFIQLRGYRSVTDTLLELSMHYEEGAKKYSERNWEKGMPCHCYVDSAVRHLLKWAGGWEDEPHDRAFLWNMFGLSWTIDYYPELNDLPYTLNASSSKEDPNMDNEY